MTHEEAQQEEREVLASIYESDECFKQISLTSFSYRGHPQSFIVEVQWGEGYPDELPDISLDSFYNNHLSQGCKTIVIEALRKEAELLLGSPMTYSLIQHAQDSAEDLFALAQTEDPIPESQEPEVCDGGGRAVAESNKKDTKEFLSKRAKRKMADRTNAQGDLPRGWDWVDVVKLSKTGSQPS